MKTFDKTYWDSNYSDPNSMDGIANAKEHTQYLKSFLALEHVHITTMIDLGCGYGDLFKSMLKAFMPYYAVGIEPSDFAFKKLERKKLKPVPSTEIKLYQEDLLHWCQRKSKDPIFDLAICTSVFQYLSDKELKIILPILAKRVKILYLTVPTDEELKRQVSELDFKDEYAIHRSRKKYQSMISPHFTCISGRVFESKIHFNEQTTPFTDLLFRY